MKIDHIGYAVKAISKSIPEFEKLGYSFEEIIVDIKRNLNICFGFLDGYRIELVSPYDKNQVSPVDNYIKRNGNTPYHICYKTPDLDKAMETLKAQKFMTVIPSEEACALGGKRVIFMFNPGIGIIEIMEE